jgi:RNA-splicing ligase RtcB
MRDGTLICRGKGNEDWNYSAPHGAGRLMSRSKAKQEVSLEAFKDSMKDVYSSTVCEATIDESPFAYKDMEEIMRAVEPTVKIIERIIPIYNYKATA